MSDWLTLQQRALANKVAKGYNLTDIPLEFCYLQGELAEAFEAWRKGDGTVGEELADVAIYLLGLSALLKLDLGEEVEKKMAIVEARPADRKAAAERQARGDWQVPPAPVYAGLEAPQAPFLRHITAFCERRGLSLLLQGSLAKGEAKAHSDIDLLLCGGLRPGQLDTLISSYGRPVMTATTENPKGILIIVYEDGTAVDLDLRETLTKEELEGGQILCDNGFPLAETLVRMNIRSAFFPPRAPFEQAQRLLHRCCVKRLCGRDASGLLEEVKQAAKFHCDARITGEMYAPVLSAALDAFLFRYPMDEGYVALLRGLIDEIAAEEGEA